MSKLLALSLRLMHSRMDLITATMLLLHHVMFPPPFVKTGSSSQMHKGVDLADPDARLFASAPPQGTALARLLTAAASTTEFNGVHNFYVSALGPIAYTNADLDDGAWAYALRPPGDGSALESRQREGAASDLSMVQCECHAVASRCVSDPQTSHRTFSMHSLRGPRATACTRSTTGRIGLARVSTFPTTPKSWLFQMTTTLTRKSG